MTDYCDEFLQKFPSLLKYWREKAKPAYTFGENPEKQISTAEFSSVGEMLSPIEKEVTRNPRLAHEIVRALSNTGINKHRCLLIARRNSSRQKKLKTFTIMFIDGIDS